MDLLANIARRLQCRADAAEHSLLLRRRVSRHARGRAAGHRPGDHGGDAAADLVHAGAGAGDDHARRHLLRRAIRRLDHRDPGQHSGRGLVRRHHHRWPSDGAAGARRARARHGGDRLVLRRLRRDAPHHAGGAAARGDRAAIRSGRIFLADGLRPDRRRGAGARLRGEGGRHGGAGPAARPRRHRRQFRHPALHLRLPGPGRRDRIRRAVDGDLRHRRGGLQPRAQRRGGQGDVDDRPRLAELGGHPDLHPDHPARHDARRAARRIAGRRRAAGGVRRLYAGEEGRAAAAQLRQRRHPRRRRAGVRQQCRRADVFHPDADAGHSLEPDHGA